MAVLHQHNPYLPLLRLRDWLETHPGVYTVTGEAMPEDTTNDQQYYNDDILVTANVIFTAETTIAASLWCDIFICHGLFDRYPRRVTFSWADMAEESVVMDSTILIGWLDTYIKTNGQVPF